MSSINRGQSSLTALRMMGDVMMISNCFVEFYMNKPVIFSVFKNTKKSITLHKNFKV